MPTHPEVGSDFVSIVVADATRIHTQLLADALRNDRGLQVVAEASNSRDLLAAVTRVPIDVVVISHNLDNQAGHGTQVLREMRALRPQIKGVILLDSSSSSEVLECFRAGARGIFSKEERIESLCKCIRSVHEGQIWARSVDLDHAIDALANSPLVRSKNNKGIELLSGRERQVIQHVAGGMSNREIAVSLKLSPHTVKNYLFRIFDKLGVSSRTELLYLTMNNSQMVNEPVAYSVKEEFGSVIAEAEAGNALAQVALAEHFSGSESSEDAGPHRHRRLKRSHKDSGESAEFHPDPVSAYMWYLLAAKTAGKMMDQIAASKNALGSSMSVEQIAEAESKAEAWLKNTKKQSSFADPAEPRHAERKIMQAGAR